MAKKQLYAIAINEGGQSRTGSGVAKRLSEQGALGGQSSVDPLAPEPGSRTIEATFQERIDRRNFDASTFAAMVEELAQASGISYVPYTEPKNDNRGADPGYYAVESADANPIEPQSKIAYEVSINLSREGSQRSHYRALECAPTPIEGAVRGGENGDGLPIADPDKHVTVALDRRARKVRWFNKVTKQYEAPEPLYQTVMGEQAVFNHYFLDSPSWYSLNDAGTDTPSPILIYQIPYDEEYKGDTRVWDTLGNPPSEKVISQEYGPEVGGTGVRVGDVSVGGYGLEYAAPSETESTFREGLRVNSTWQRVFATDHDFSGATVLSNGVLRMILDEGAGVIRCQRSRGHFDEWAEQPLRPSAWALFDVDVTHIGLARVEAQIEFRHGRVGDRYTLNVSLPRGYRRARWSFPENQDSGFPASLFDKLQPIATGGRHIDPNGRAGLVPRSEVRL